MSKNKLKAQSSKPKAVTQNARILVLSLSFIFYLLCFALACFAQEQFVYDAKGKRNPFIPLVTSEGRLLNLDKEEGRGKEDLLIEGLIYDKNGRSFAIVNGSVVGVGDTIGNYQVLKIEENRIIFIKEGQTKEIKIEKGEK